LLALAGLPVGDDLPLRGGASWSRGLRIPALGGGLKDRQGAESERNHMMQEFRRLRRLHGPPLVDDVTPAVGAQGTPTGGSAGGEDRGEGGKGGSTGALWLSHLDLSSNGIGLSRRSCFPASDEFDSWWMWGYEWEQDEGWEWPKELASWEGAIKGGLSPT